MPERAEASTRLGHAQPTYKVVAMWREHVQTGAFKYEAEQCDFSFHPTLSEANEGFLAMRNKRAHTPGLQVDLVAIHPDGRVTVSTTWNAPA